MTSPFRTVSQAPRRWPIAAGQRSSPRRHHLLAWLGLVPNEATRYERRLVQTLFVVVVVAWLAAVLFMATVPFTGDEKFYANNAAAIARLLRGRGPSSSDVVGDVVGYGWFMPGVSIALTPLYLLDSEPSVAAVRTYASGLVFLLWVWTLRELSSAFGRHAGVVMVVFPTLATTWLMFTATIWADLSAGLLLAIVAVRTYLIAMRLVADRPVPPRDVVILELVMVATVYLRGNAIAAVVASHIFLFGVAIVSGHWSRLLRRTAVLGAGVVLFLALLAPWTLVASRTLGDVVVTTSSAPLSVALTFGDADEVCFGPCEATKNVWFAAVEYSREYGRRHGISEIEAQQRMAAYALRDLTFSGYRKKVGRNFESFVTRPSGFVRRFAGASTLGFKKDAARAIMVTIKRLTVALYAPFLVALVVANAAVFVRSRRLQVLSLCVKVFTASLFLQPFLHPSHPRYWVAFAPLMTIAAISLLQWRPNRRTAVAAGDVPTDREHITPTVDTASWALAALQAVYVVGVAAIALAIWSA